jgi:hypothetical protein
MLHGQATICEVLDRGAKVHKYISFVHEGNSSQAGLENTNRKWLCLQSIRSVKHNAAKSVSRSILKKSRHIGFGVFLVHSSICLTPIVNRISNISYHLQYCTCFVPVDKSSVQNPTCLVDIFLIASTLYT